MYDHDDCSKKQRGKENEKKKKGIGSNLNSSYCKEIFRVSYTTMYTGLSGGLEHLKIETR